MSKHFGNSYEGAVQFLGSKTSRKIDNNTYLEKYSDREYAAVRLHSTEVVRYFPNGDIQLNSGGYRTVTTKDKLNVFSPARVYQRDFSWFVNEGEKFQDNIVIR